MYAINTRNKIVFASLAFYIELKLKECSSDEQMTKEPFIAVKSKNALDFRKTGGNLLRKGEVM